MNSYKNRLQQAIYNIKEAEYLVVGGGAGLSDAAGLQYGGHRFTQNFADFIERYAFTDMYTAGFYPFETQEEFWAYWARHISFNRYKPSSAPLYKNLVQLVGEKEYFVITTNVDGQFCKTGIPKNKLWMVQGDYAFLQCGKPCHNHLYYNEAQIKEMLHYTKDCKIPTKLVPRCTVCGGPMKVHIHSDSSFIQGECWLEAKQAYTDYIRKIRSSRTVFLELGVGFNTPGIIRFPFERFVYQNKEAILIRMNNENPEGAIENMDRTLAFAEDMTEIIQALVTGIKK